MLRTGNSCCCCLIVLYKEMGHDQSLRPKMTLQDITFLHYEKIRDFARGICFKDNPVVVVMVGLDGAGKTTTLYQLKLNQAVSTIPTLGFNVEKVSPCKGLSLTVWDVGGQEIIRRLWRHYYHNAAGIIFVIDSNDRARIDLAREELFGVLEAADLEHVPLLVFANKQDLPCAAPVPKITQVLGLNRLNRKWHIQGSCASNGRGIFEGFLVFAQMVKQDKKRRGQS